jgi:membrane-bound serine protease (ClpP class)
VLFVVALVFALVFLPEPWSLAVIASAAAGELVFWVLGVRYTRRNAPRVGVETMVGDTAEVITALAPTGQVKVDGAIWQAHAIDGAQVGDRVRIQRVDGLTLEVARDR